MIEVSDTVADLELDLWGSYDGGDYTFDCGVCGVEILDGTSFTLRDLIVAVQSHDCPGPRTLTFEEGVEVERVEKEAEARRNRFPVTKGKTIGVVPVPRFDPPPLGFRGSL
jgi:hypothetical protein